MLPAAKQPGVNWRWPASNTSYITKSYSIIGNRTRSGRAERSPPIDKPAGFKIYIDYLVRYLIMLRQDALQGSLPLLVLKILPRRGPLPGYGITAHIEAISNLLRVEEGSLYPALHRMEEAGWIRAKWTTTENKRRARIYAVTEAGRKQLADEEHRWTSITAAVGLV